MPLRARSARLAVLPCAFGVAMAIAAPGCSRPSPAPGGPPGQAAAAPGAPVTRGKQGVIVEEASPSGDAATLVRDRMAEARASGRTVVVYVGATWCEPCQRFHEAALRGELDADFPSLTMVAFDLDRDRERLAQAGYVSRYIPLFALPSADGSASGRQIEGAIKGEGAVDFIVPKLKELLSR